jgi:cytochrome c oxidase cbb3-type subunit 3
VTISALPSDAPPAVDTNASPAQPEKHGADLLDHEYDGIREYDNPLPGWWKKIFWGTFLFAIGYGFHYHLSGNGVSVQDAYDAEMAEVRADQARHALAENVNEDGLKTLMLDSRLMADAKGIFALRCTPCHGEHAQGVIGPNLTDGYWLHGQGTLLDIHHTVSEGVPAKGMPSWKMQLSPVQVRMVAAYVGSLRNTNAAGKAPEGVPAAPPAL